MPRQRRRPLIKIRSARPISRKRTDAWGRLGGCRALSCLFAQEPQEPHASRSSAAAQTPHVRLISLLFAAFSAAMLGLAAGAVWMLPTMALQRPLPILALAAGWLLALAVRAWVRPPGHVAAALAAGATVLAAIYVDALTAAARIAGAMGIGLLDALREAGPSMLLALARLAVRPADTALTLAGALLAAWVASRRRKA
jgi:vitamin B12 transport system permease protein